MNKAEIMKEFREKQSVISLSYYSDEKKFKATKQLVIDTELKLKELKENDK